MKRFNVQRYRFTSLTQRLYRCSDGRIELVNDMPTDDVSKIDTIEKITVKKKPFVGAITLLVSLPVIIWFLVIIVSDKNYYPDTIGGVLLFFQALGIVCALLLFTGKSTGYYLAILNWVFFFTYGVANIFYTSYLSSTLAENTAPLYSWLLAITGLPVLCFLLSGLRGIKKEV